MFHEKVKNQGTKRDHFILKCLLLASLVVGATLNAAADPVVFDNGKPNQQNGNLMTDHIQANAFTLGSSTDITAVTFWSLQGSAADYRGSISWGIYTDAAGTPGSRIDSGNAAATNVATGLLDASMQFPEFQNDFNLAVGLTAGTYWLVLHDGPVLASDSDPNVTPQDFSWEWTDNNNRPGGQEIDLVAGGGFNPNFNEHAFTLAGNPVPEPATLSLLGSGLMGLGFTARRRWTKK